MPQDLTFSNLFPLSAKHFDTGMQEDEELFIYTLKSLNKIYKVFIFSEKDKSP